jgi:hypothetical protein
MAWDVEILYPGLETGAIRQLADKSLPRDGAETRQAHWYTITHYRCILFRIRLSDGFVMPRYDEM